MPYMIKEPGHMVKSNRTTRARGFAPAMPRERGRELCSLSYIAIDISNTKGLTASCSQYPAELQAVAVGTTLRERALLLPCLLSKEPTLNNGEGKNPKTSGNISEPLSMQNS